jgi:hypothetical protein
MNYPKALSQNSHGVSKWKLVFVPFVCYLTTLSASGLYINDDRMIDEMELLVR